MYQKPFVGKASDYSKKRNWLSLPENPDKAVDLFYLYPSSCENARLRAKTWFETK